MLTLTESRFALVALERCPRIRKLASSLGSSHVRPAGSDRIRGTVGRPNAGTTQVATFDATGAQFTCSDGTTYTALGGTVHSVMHDSFSADGAEHVTGTVSPTGVTLTDGTTSTVYTLGGATWFGGNLNEATGQFEFADTGWFRGRAAHFRHPPANANGPVKPGRRRKCGRRAWRAHRRVRAAAPLPPDSPNRCACCREERSDGLPPKGVICKWSGAAQTISLKGCPSSGIYSRAGA